MLFLFLFLLQDLPPYEERIVVTAERIEQPWEDATAAVTVLGGEALAQTTAQNLGDALRLVPGLQIIDVNPGTPPMISSRGFFGAGEVEYLQLVVDGAPVADIESGLADWRSIPIESIERVEILRGAGSSLFGDTAIGGVVQVFRREGTHASLSIGSFETARWSASYSDDAFSASANGVRSDGFREHGASTEWFGGVAYQRGALRLSLDAADRERDDPGALTREQMESDRSTSDPIFEDDRDENRTIRVAARYRGAVDASVYAHRRTGDRVRTLLLAPGFGDRARRSIETSALGASAMKTMQWRSGRIAGGIEGERDSLESTYTITHDVRRRRGAAFLTSEWRITDSVRLAGGARWDSIGDDFEGLEIRDEAISPRAGLAAGFGAVTAYLQVSRAFKAPTLAQRFDQRPLPDFSGGTFTISNPALKPQRSTNVEIGVRHARTNHAWELVAYHTEVEDEIDFDVRTFRYGNIGRSTHRGAEAMAQWTSGAGQMALAYAWTRAESGGRQLKNIAEHVARADFDVRAFVDVHVAIEHAANRWLDDDNRFALDDATVVDVRIARTIASITASLEANNLFDRDYAPLGFLLGNTAYYYPAAGRSVSMTVRWNGGAR